MTTNKPDSRLQNVLVEMWREACDRGTTLGFKVVSDSMGPLIQTGDVVRVNGVQPASLHTGDIAVFRQGDSIVVHRIIGKSFSDGKYTFRHMGDAGLACGTFTDRELIGKVSAVKKGEREIRLDSTGRIIIGKLLGWRLRLRLRLSRSRPGLALRLVLKPAWRVVRGLILRG